MSLIADIKKLRELEQKAKKDYVENGNWYRYNAEKLAPAMIEVLECFKEGDAELLKDAANSFSYNPTHKQYHEMLCRLQNAAFLMEKGMEQ